MNVSNTTFSGNQTGYEKSLNEHFIEVTTALSCLGLLRLAYAKITRKNSPRAALPERTLLSNDTRATKVRVKTQDLFVAFQNLTKNLDINCSLLEKRYVAQLNQANVAERAVIALKGCLNSAGSIENALSDDLLVMNRIEKDYERINAIQKKFKKSFVFAEANLAVYDCRVQNLSKIFQRHVVGQEKNNDEKDQPVLKSMLDQQTASFADIMGSYVYTHLPLSGEVSLYYSPWGSRADILRRLDRCGFLGSKEMLPSYVTPEEPTYKGYGINFHYCVFGMRCTLVSLMKLDVQYEQAMKRFGIEEKGIFHSLTTVMNRFQDPSKTEETQKNQQKTLDKFLRLEALGLLYADNYAACHIPTEQELVNDYQLPLSQIAKNDFIVFYHRPFDKNLTDAFSTGPFACYKNSKNFLLRMDNNDLEDVQKKHKDAVLYFSNVLHTRAEVEARRVMTEYHLLEESLNKEKTLRDQISFKDWEAPPSTVSVEEIKYDEMKKL